MANGEIMTIVTVIGAVFSFLGISGVDSAVISQAVTGIISLITIGSALYVHFAHKKTVAALGAQQPQ